MVIDDDILLGGWDRTLPVTANGSTSSEYTSQILNELIRRMLAAEERLRTIEEAP